MKCSAWLLALSLLSTLPTISSFAAITQCSAQKFRLSTNVVDNPTVSRVRNIGMSTEDSSEVQPTSTGSEDSTTPTKPPVKCPNCDLCDGSGRYVISLTGWLMIKVFFIPTLRRNVLKITKFTNVSNVQNRRRHRCFSGMVAHQGLQTLSKFHWKRRILSTKRPRLGRDRLR